MPLERRSGKAAQTRDARVRTPIMLEVPEGENRVSIVTIVQACLPGFRFRCCAACHAARRLFLGELGSIPSSWR
jgi:hypothetical protein